MKEMFTSAVHMIIKKDGKVLVQKRIGTKLWNNFYALPAGHVDKGENQYDALIREAKEELDINIGKDNIKEEYVVLRRNYFEMDGKQSDPYIDFYFELDDIKDTPVIAESDKCAELIWCDINDLPKPFINYEGAFLENKNIKTYDCENQGAYIK